MSSSQPPTKRAKFDLTTTFEVEVGDAPSSQQRFTVYANVLTSRSEFFRASRSSQWLTDPIKPVDLKAEDPEIFSLYLNCVYFGVEAIQMTQESGGEDIAKDQSEDDSRQDEESPVTAQGRDAFEVSETEYAARLEVEVRRMTGLDMREIRHQESLVMLYLLADKLQDPTTANVVIDEISRFGEEIHTNLGVVAVNLAYKGTTHGNPLRRYIRDCFVLDYEPSFYMDIHTRDYPGEFYRDVTVQYLRLKDVNGSKTVDEVYRGRVSEIYELDKCRYHQHNDKHPRCMPVVVIE